MNTTFSIHKSHWLINYYFNWQAYLIKATFFLLLSLFIQIGIIQKAQAEIQLGVNGQLHNSFQVKGEAQENFTVERAWFGFDAYTPKGFAKLNLQLEEANVNSTHTNALPYILREAYTGMRIGDYFKIMLGLKNVPYGMLLHDKENTLGEDSVHYLMGLKQATGLQLQFQYKRFTYDLGVFNPAYRAQFITTENRVIESVSRAPLFASRLSYEVGKLLTIQGSFAIQEYGNIKTINETYHATRYFDFGINIDFSPKWGMLYNYSQVEYAFGSSSDDIRTATLIQVDWTPNRYWQLYVRSTEAFDQTVESQLLLHVGAVYQVDKHNRLLINANLGSNNKDYTGFLGEQNQSFLLQHQFNF